MNLDALIKQLQSLREEFGGSLPVGAAPLAVSEIPADMGRTGATLIRKVPVQGVMYRIEKIQISRPQTDQGLGDALMLLLFDPNERPESTEIEGFIN